MYGITIGDAIFLLVLVAAAGALYLGLLRRLFR